MSTYKGIKGFKVQSLSADPVPSTVSWASGGSMNTGRRELGAANQAPGHEAGLIFGGYKSPAGPTNATEEYNGTSWTAGGNMTTSRQRLAGAGTQTAGLAFGGGYPPTNHAETEEYDGSSWTNGGNLGTARGRLGGSGIQTAGLAFGGSTVAEPPSKTNATEEYDGSSWTAGGALSVSRFMLGGGGTQTAGIAFGGNTNPPPARTNATEEYGGTSWTSGGTLGTARYLLSGAGSQDAAIAAGGNDGSETAACELYNGTSWTATASLNATASYAAASGSSNEQALNMGGNAYKTATEEFTNFQEPNVFRNIGDTFYNDTEKKFKFIAEGAQSWATGGSLSDARYGFWASFGLQTAAVACGGADSPNEFFATTFLLLQKNTMVHRGTSGGNIPTALGSGGSLGTLTAGFGAGAYRFSPGS